MIKFLIVFLVIRSQCLINKCAWTQMDSKTTLSTLFEYSERWNCLFSILHENNAKEQIQEFLFFLDGVSLCEEKEPNIQCELESGPIGSSCSALCIQFFQMTKEPPLQITIKNGQNIVESSDISIRLTFKEEASIGELKGRNSKSRKNIKIKAKNNLVEKKLHSLDKSIEIEEESLELGNRLFFSFLLFFPILLSEKEKTLSIYKWMQIGIFIEILLVSGKWMGGELSGHLNGWELLFTICINLILILFQLKNIFQFVDHSTYAFSELIPLGIEIHSPDRSTNQVENNLTVVIPIWKTINRKLNEIIYKVKTIYVLWQSLGVIIFLLLSVSKYELAFLGVWGLMTIMSPHYLNTKGTNATTVIETHSIHHIKKEEKKLLESERDSILFPKYKISTYFLIILLKVVFSSCGLFEFDFAKICFQIAYILTIWSITMILVYKQIEKIKGKKTYIYQPKLTSNLNNNMEEEICSICLEQIPYEIPSKSIQTECKHIFHAECLQKWTKKKMICPVERNILNPSSFQQCLKKLFQEYEE